MPKNKAEELNIIDVFETSVVAAPANPIAVAKSIEEVNLEEIEKQQEDYEILDEFDKPCAAEDAILLGIAAFAEDEEALKMLLEEIENPEAVEKAEYSTAPWNPPSTKSGREKLLKKCGRRAFLMPDQLKFPVMTRDCKYNINGVRAAIRRAAQHGYTEVLAKARRLLQRLLGKTQKSEEGGEMKMVEEKTMPEKNVFEELKKELIEEVRKQFEEVIVKKAEEEVKKEAEPEVVEEEEINKVSKGITTVDIKKALENKEEILNKVAEDLSKVIYKL